MTNEKHLNGQLSIPVLVTIQSMLLTHHVFLANVYIAVNIFFRMNWLDFSVTSPESCNGLLTVTSGGFSVTLLQTLSLLYKQTVLIQTVYKKAIKNKTNSNAGL